MTKEEFERRIEKTIKDMKYGWREHSCDAIAENFPDDLCMPKAERQYRESIKHLFRGNSDFIDWVRLDIFTIKGRENFRIKLLENFKTESMKNKFYEGL